MCASVKEIDLMTQNNDDSKQVIETSADKPFNQKEHSLWALEKINELFKDVIIDKLIFTYVTT